MQAILWKYQSIPVDCIVNVKLEASSSADKDSKLWCVWHFYRTTAEKALTPIACTSLTINWYGRLLLEHPIQHVSSLSRSLLRCDKQGVKSFYSPEWLKHWIFQKERNQALSLKKRAWSSWMDGWYGVYSPFNIMGQAAAKEGKWAKWMKHPFENTPLNTDPDSEQTQTWEH